MLVKATAIIQKLCFIFMSCMTSQNVDVLVIIHLIYLKVSDWEKIGGTSGFLRSEICSDKCPNFCERWESFATSNDPWTEDPDFTIKCRG